MCIVIVIVCVDFLDGVRGVLGIKFVKPFGITMVAYYKRIWGPHVNVPIPLMVFLSLHKMLGCSVLIPFFY